MTASHRLILVFGRYPVPGGVKTRLIPAIGAFGAALLQRRLTEKCLDAVLASGTAPVLLCYAGGSRSRAQRWVGRYGIVCRRQTEGDLGRRMRAALENAFDRGYSRVLLVGTDVPGLRAGHLKAAFAALDRCDVVLGPSTDGGYWLVGLRRPAPIFDHVDWGTSRVLEQTMAAARKAGLSLELLDRLDDIDTPEDVMNWRPEAMGGPYISIVIPTLNEAARIGDTVSRVVGPEREVIVADGGSTDETISIAERAGARVIRAPRGRDAQQNAGAVAARGDVLLFLHADTRLPKDFVYRVFDTLMPSDVVFGAFGFKTDYDRPAMRLIEKTANLRSRLLGLPYGDQGFFMHREVFFRAKGFPRAAIAEDLLLARRLTKMGRFAQASGDAVTSGRRWRAIGVWRATLVNYLIAVGCLLGIDTRRLAPLYRLWTK